MAAQKIPIPFLYPKVSSAPYVMGPMVWPRLSNTEYTPRDRPSPNAALSGVCSKYEYWQVLYDRIPTLPQSLNRDFGIMTHLWQNIAHRVARTRKR